MNIRLITGVLHSGDLVWRIETRRWYWPFWRLEDYFLTYDEAKAFAIAMKNPTIERIS